MQMPKSNWRLMKNAPIQSHSDSPTLCTMLFLYENNTIHQAYGGGEAAYRCP